MGQTVRLAPGNSSQAWLADGADVSVPDLPREPPGGGSGQSDCRGPQGQGSPAQRGSEVRASGGAWGPRPPRQVTGRHTYYQRHTCDSREIAPLGFGAGGGRWGAHVTSHSRACLGLSEEITVLSCRVQRKHLVKTSKPQKVLLALPSLLTEPVTDSVSVHQG